MIETEPLEHYYMTYTGKQDMPVKEIYLSFTFSFKSIPRELQTRKFFLEEHVERKKKTVMSCKKDPENRGGFLYY